MLKFTYMAVATVALLAGAPSLASAKSVKELVSESTLADFCSDAGVGSDTAVSVELSDGSSVSGTIQCEEEDLVVGDIDDASADDILDSGDDVDDDQSDDPDDQHADKGLGDSDDGQDTGDTDDRGSEGSDESEDSDD